MCLRILEYVAFSPEPGGVTQIADSAGLAKSAAFKHLQTLMDHGFVTQDLVTSRYRLGPKAWLIGQQAQSLNDFTAIALPFMLAARNETGLAVVMSTPMPGAAFVTLTCASTHQIEIGVRTGSQLALHGSAQGKIFLAFGAPQQLEDLRVTPLTAVTPHTITDWNVLAAEVAAARKAGFASAPQEALLGINTMAAPVFNYDGKLIASVAFVGSIQHIPTDPDPVLVQRLKTLTQDISRALGAQG
ncbi:IclR family transcriptional regulator [Paracoccus aminophilus]|nr:IclR family transcriptional regulator [Paracoccus aminophilus]